MTAPSKRYKRVKQDEQHKLVLLRSKLLRLHKAGLLTYEELKGKLLTIGGFVYPIHAEQWIATNVDKTSSTHSYREERRRSLITAYNQGRLNETQLEDAITPLFVLDGTHPENTTSVTSTKERHLYIAKRSKRFAFYLLTNFPSLYKDHFQHISFKEQKLEQRTSRINNVLEQIKKEINNGK